jgi:hypothetical protein
MMRGLVLLVLLGTAGACRPAAADRDREPAGTVDSVVPRARELAEFRRGFVAATRLEGGEPTREALVRRFVRALETGDTIALRRQLLSRAEFAWLYYPTTTQAGPPYDLGPDLLWFTLFQRSDRDIALALREFGGRPFGYLGHTCAAAPRVEGDNRIWGYCAIRRRAAGRQPTTERLFGLIIERGGRYKFVSYANKL